MKMWAWCWKIKHSMCCFVMIRSGVSGISGISTQWQWKNWVFTLLEGNIIDKQLYFRKICPGNNEYKLYKLLLSSFRHDMKVFGDAMISGQLICDELIQTCEWGSWFLDFHFHLENEFNSKLDNVPYHWKSFYCQHFSKLMKPLKWLP